MATLGHFLAVDAFVVKSAPATGRRRLIVVDEIRLLTAG
jgi:hypothetical protein